MITLSALKSVLHYNPDTGVFTWLIPTSRMGSPGSRAGRETSGGYRQIQIFGKLYAEHRLAWFYMTGNWPDEDVDHKIGKSNVWSNLRLATKSQNNMNRRAQKNNKCGIKGVCWNGHAKRWMGSVYLNKKRHHAGYFDSIEDAEKAVTELRAKLHGEFSCNAKN